MKSGKRSEVGHEPIGSICKKKPIRRVYLPPPTSQKKIIIPKGIKELGKFLISYETKERRQENESPRTAINER